MSVKRVMEDKKGKPPVRKSQYASIDGIKRPDPSLYKVNSASLSNLPGSESKLAAMPRRMPSQPPIQNQTNVAPKLATQPILNLDLPDEAPVKRRRFSRKNKAPISRRRKIVKRTALSLTLLIIVTGGFLGIKGLTTINKVFHGNVISDVTAAFNDHPLDGESTGRVNILLAGDSSDQLGHGGADLTDSILILSVDTQNNTAFMLSIPRDLWVYVPGLGSYQKINAANDVTNFSQAGYPKGGIGQLEEIIKTDFGIPINYYGLMDYGAFKDSVDAVGGVTININSTDPRGLYDPNTSIKLPNGPVTLDGQQALDLARARGDGYGSYGFPDSDFDRTEHQRQLFVAVAAKAKTAGVLANPIKISSLISTLGSNFQTDMTLQNVLRLIQVTKPINLNTIQSYSFSSTLTGSTNPILESYVDPSSGEDALAPTAGIGDYSGIKQYYQQLTSTNPVVKEDASVVILNASSVVGLAKREETLVQSAGINNTSIYDADNEYPGTLIVDNSAGKDPATKALLEKDFPGSVVTTDAGNTEAAEAQPYSTNFVVILGQNWDDTANP